MTAKTRLEKVLKKARKTLVKNKLIPISFCIRSKNAAIPPVIIRPDWYGEEDKRKGCVELHRICREIEAREVIIVCEGYLYDINNQESEGIVVSLEDYNGMQSVILPFKMRGDGKFSFGKESWKFTEKKDIAGRMAGLVQ